MDNIYRLKTLCIICLIGASVLYGKRSIAQTEYQPYSFQLNDKLSKDLYSTSTDLHTSLKPYVITDSSPLKAGYDSIMNRGVDPSRKGLVIRKLLNEHLLEVKNPDYTFYFDYLPDLLIGREFKDHYTTSLNTRGYQAGGTIGSKIYFYTSGFENQGKFPNYLNKYVLETDMVPGQAYDFNNGIGSKDWTYATSIIGYSPSSKVNIEAGVDKTFIGDGYRSMLLSDFASNYPLIRLKIDLAKNVRYMVMWAYMQDQNAPKLDSLAHAPNRIKWGVFHYIDWNVTNRFSLGFFNALIAPADYAYGSSHGFDVNYINPILFIKSAGPSGPIPDNTLIGFNAKYKIFDKTVLYSQYIYDQLASSGNSKDGFQLGLRGADLLNVNSFNYLVEFNTAKPYTTATQYPLVNYTDLDEPLAHPFGSNFKEAIGILSYSIGRFDFRGELDYAKFYLNLAELNVGNGILFPDLTSQIATTTQGQNTTFKYAQGTVSYLINPKYNLRLELGATYRDEDNSQYHSKTALINFGLRSTFRDLYTDF
ncbi:gliding motility protein RemB [Mucilaginibacter sp.]